MVQVAWNRSELAWLRPQIKTEMPAPNARRVRALLFQGLAMRVSAAVALTMEMLW